MKKSLLVTICFLIVGYVSIGQTNNSIKVTPAIKESKPAPDFNVALKFINDYISFCVAEDNKQTSLSEDDWVAKSQLVTKNFKNTYKKLTTDALKKDSVLGLDFDPILDAQDYPEKGCSILKQDLNTGYVTMVGNGWKDFTVTLRIVYQNNKWLVDGAGIINIPASKWRKR